VLQQDFWYSFEIELAGASIMINRTEGASEEFTEVLSTDAAAVLVSDYIEVGVGELADYAIDDIRVSHSDAPPPDTPLADAFHGYDALGRLVGQEVAGVKT
jgi:hypothetical protein